MQKILDRKQWSANVDEPESLEKLCKQPPQNGPLDKFQVTHFSAYSLAKGHLLNDEVLNSSIHYILHWLGTDSSGPIAATDTYFQPKIASSWTLSSKSKTKVLDKTQQTELDRYKHMNYNTSSRKHLLDHDVIIIPINVPNTHWYLFIVDTFNKVMKLYDSLTPSGFTKDQEEMFVKLSNFFNASTYAKVTDSPTNRWRLVNEGCPKQTAEKGKSGLGVDCGIFVLLCITSYLQSKTIQFDQAYIYEQKIREKIFLNLYNGDFSKYPLL